MLTAPRRAPFLVPRRQCHFHPTRQVNVTSPTAANIAAVLAIFFADLRKRGVKKSS
jgi:hypothetical protein